MAFLDFRKLNEQVNKPSQSYLTGSTFRRKGVSGLKDVPQETGPLGIFFKLTPEKNEETYDKAFTDADSMYFLAPGENILEGHQHEWRDADDHLRTMAAAGASFAIGGAINSILPNKITGSGIGKLLSGEAVITSLPFILQGAARARGEGNPYTGFLISLDSVYTGSGDFAIGFTTHMVCMNDPIQDVIEPATYLRDMMYGQLSANPLKNFGKTKAGEEASLVEQGAKYIGKGLDLFNNKVVKNIGGSVGFLKAPPRWKLEIGNPFSRNIETQSSVGSGIIKSNPAWWARYANLVCKECNIEWRAPYRNGLPTAASISMNFVTAQKVHREYFDRENILIGLQSFDNPDKYSGTSDETKAVSNNIRDLETGARTPETYNTILNSDSFTGDLSNVTSDVGSMNNYVQGAAGSATASGKIDLIAKQSQISSYYDTIVNSTNKMNTSYGEPDGSFSFTGIASIQNFHNNFSSVLTTNQGMTNVLAGGLTIANSYLAEGDPEIANLIEQWGGLRALGLSVSDTTGPMRDLLETLEGGNAIGAYLKGVIL